ncbi:MAG TPA: YetF domain-containing protein [Vicinamibacteria bacterium]|nr:YetF domain-containing protein [Vicinamibacteria bacterium]
MEELRTLVVGLGAGPLEIAFIAFRTLVVYFFILAAFRLSGKREVGQLAPFDFALILLIANAVQNAMVGPDASLAGGLSAAAVLLLANLALGRLATRNRKVERLLRGQARILVNRGHVHGDALHAENISHEELLQALRENGCATLSECRLAVLEVDGSISVIQNRA